MQLNISGKNYTFVYSVAATMCDDLLETVTNVVKVAGGDANDASLAIAGKLPSLTKSLFYGGLLQMHGRRGDNSVKTKEDAEDLLFQYMTENEGKKEGTLAYIFNGLYEQMGADNFLSRIGLTDENESEKVTPINKSKKSVGGAE